MVREAIPATSKIQGECLGTFSATLEIGSADRQQFEAVEALVDTGAIFSRIPGSLLRRLGHSPEDRQSFELGDGTIVEWDVSDVPVRFRGKVRVTSCIWGPEDATPIFGAVTMEQFLVMADPSRQELVPVVGPFMMVKHGKKYVAAIEKIDREKTYEPKEAVGLLKEIAYAKFDETVELHIRTGLDTRHAEQQLRGTLTWRWRRRR